MYESYTRRVGQVTLTSEQADIAVTAAVNMAIKLINKLEEKGIYWEE